MKKKFGYLEYTPFAVVSKESVKELGKFHTWEEANQFRQCKIHADISGKLNEDNLLIVVDKLKAGEIVFNLMLNDYGRKAAATLVSDEIAESKETGEPVNTINLIKKLRELGLGLAEANYLQNFLRK